MAAIRQKREESTLVWRAAKLFNSELKSARYTAYRYGKHLHGEFTIGVVEQGVGMFECRGEAVFATENSVFINNPYEVHTGGSYSDKSVSYRAFYLDESFVAESFGIENEQAKQIRFSEKKIQDPTFAGKILDIHLRSESQAQFGRPLQDFSIESNFVQTFGAFFLQHAKVGLKENSFAKDRLNVSKAVEYLHDNLIENVTLKKLAREVGLNPFHLIRLFEQSVGLPPHQYLIRLKIAKAKDLLKRGTAPVEVAYEVGFSDQSHLTKLFKREIGLTPGSYFKRSNFIQEIKI